MIEFKSVRIGTAGLEHPIITLNNQILASTNEPIFRRGCKNGGIFQGRVMASPVLKNTFLDAGDGVARLYKWYAQKNHNFFT